MLASLIALAGIGSIGTVSFLNKEDPQPQITEETKPQNEIPKVKEEENIPPVEAPAPVPQPLKIEQPKQPEISDVKEQELEAIKKEEPSPKPTAVVEEQKDTEVQEVAKEEAKSPNQEDGEIDEIMKGIERFQSGGRIYDGDFLKGLVKRSLNEAKFLTKTEAISWKGNSNFTEQQKTSAKSKFKESNIVKQSQGKWELIDYDNHQDWRYKTIQYMRDEENTPRDLFLDIEERGLNIDEESGMEEFAGKLRDLCYGSMEEIENTETIKKKFAAHDSLQDETKIINLCSFSANE